MIRLEPQTLRFNYTNHKGINGERRAETRSMRFGTSQYWPGSAPQWHMLCIDLDKNVEREFRVTGMGNVVVG